ncbi:DUF1643 domain-containing protein [Tropicimonas sediminicola]|uniref:DUF1643 domain-containing protein n=1 Tax=Tropicimonas sediminicola TaxID=1031541 RepID=A0A239L5B3_9RHOB|nr:DUF1643 domain-containing protein [Tropicimonas sediminicola]SNT25013.1 hypothetical protein SAMN05421757_108246 [Tropicimonas sediminicola]
MIVRHHATEAATSSAAYSECESYRYSLARTWEANAPRLLYIMLNPSKATEAVNDPTIERCERRARALGFGGFTACNLFAWRETDPQALRRAAEPVGPENDAALLEAAGQSQTILCAWGVHGVHLGRAADVGRSLREAGHTLHHLGLTRHGHPRHPLYVSYATRPELWLAA